MTVRAALVKEWLSWPRLQVSCTGDGEPLSPRPLASYRSKLNILDHPITAAPVPGAMRLMCNSRREGILCAAAVAL
ncbi:MAG: hypothetical protein WBV94_29850 [Blastocatellia bacterium]